MTLQHHNRAGLQQVSVVPQTMAGTEHGGFSGVRWQCQGLAQTTRWVPPLPALSPSYLTPLLTT